jgi:hypothetical protein
MIPTLCVFNESTVLTDAQVEAIVSTLQQQVSEDFQPHYGVDASLVFIPSGQSIPTNAWWLGVFDNSDQAGALGYHDTTNEGLPLGKVFAGTDLQYGASWTVTMSHEILEMVEDPFCDYLVMAGAGRHHVLYADEACDAVEADNYGYKINNIPVSNFVLPSWYSPSFPGPWDRQGLLKAPFTLLPGGYVSIYSFTGGGWNQITAEQDQESVKNLPTATFKLYTGERYRQRAHVGSRRERRRIPKEQWVKSERTALTRAVWGALL